MSGYILHDRWGSEMGLAEHRRMIYERNRIAREDAKEKSMTNPLPRVWCPTCKRMVNALEVRQDGHHEKLVFDKKLHSGIGGRWVTCPQPTSPNEPVQRGPDHHDY